MEIFDPITINVHFPNDPFRVTGREFPEENLRAEQDNILDLCRNHGVQNCHLCDCIHCGDNLKWTGRANATASSRIEIQTTVTR